MNNVPNLFKKIFINPFLVFKGEREKVFDLLKLAAMLFVVLDHCLQRSCPNCQTTQVYNFIFLTQMPVFMFVSGYFALKQIYKIQELDIKDKTTYLVKKILSLLVPFVSFSIIEAILSQNFTIIYKSFYLPQNSLWFLWALLFLELFIYFSQIISLKIFRNISFKTFALSCFLFCFTLVCVAPLYLFEIVPDVKLILYYSLFFMFGYLFAFLVIFVNPNILEKTIIKLLVFIISLIVVVVVMILRPTLILDPETPLNILLRVLGSIGSIMVFYEGFSLLPNSRILDMISRAGRISLEFYFIHLLVLKIPSFNQEINNVLFFALEYLLVVTITFSIICILKTNILTNFVFFGKIQKKR